MVFDQHVTIFCQPLPESKHVVFHLGVGMTLGGLLATGFAALNLGPQTVQSLADSPCSDAEVVKQIGMSRMNGT